MNAVPVIEMARPRKGRSQLLQFALNAMEGAADAGVCFVQVGANDGVLADPIQANIANGGWTGIMIEPHPVYFNDLSNRYAGNPAMQLVRCAISDVPGEMELYSVSEDQTAHYPPWARGCASLDRARLHAVIDGHRDGNGPVAEGDIEATLVPVRRLDEVLASAGVTTCDVLLVDVEGFETQVLNSVDLNALSPKLVVVECNGPNRGDQPALVATLAQAGLSVFRLRDDLVGLDPSLTVPLGTVLELMGQSPLSEAVSPC